MQIIFFIIDLREDRVLIKIPLKIKNADKFFYYDTNYNIFYYGTNYNIFYII